MFLPVFSKTQYTVTSVSFGLNGSFTSLVGIITSLGHITSFLNISADLLLSSLNLCQFVIVTIYLQCLREVYKQMLSES